MKVFIALIMLAGVLGITAISRAGYAADRNALRQMAENGCLAGGPPSATDTVTSLQRKHALCSFALTGVAE